MTKNEQKLYDECQRLTAVLEHIAAGAHGDMTLVDVVKMAESALPPHKRRPVEVDEEPDHDDTVHCCPDCERPNQFGELCPECERENSASVS